MPRTEEQNREIKERRKLKIMEKALMLFATRGFDAITVDDITKEVGCSHGLFYHYFAGKEDVYNALMSLKDNQKYDEYRLPTKRALEAGGIAGLRIFAEYAERIAQADDTVFYFVRLALTRQMTQTAKGALMGIDLYPDFLKLIQEAQKDGDVYEGNPREIANMYIDFCNGAMDRRFAMGRGKFEIVHAPEIMRLYTKC
ncbi:MAG: TetR/AcrR family transcriptional regulator [Bacilli bacterium]|jgi:AcrR family transcriptional regulator|nr:TetR/AcrR family transcriptional regulator [Bacilli bacterium]